MIPLDIPATPTPGVQRVIHFTVRGGSFGFRRPSRADEAEIARRTSAALINDTHNRLDGFNVQADAQLEVCLRPRVTRMGEEINLGETAPAHWLEPITDGLGKVIGQRVSFANVMIDEYNEVVKVVMEALAVPNDSAPGSSTSAATGATSA
jgi:hypothetical protein